MLSLGFFPWIWYSLKWIVIIFFICYILTPFFYTSPEHRPTLHDAWANTSPLILNYHYLDSEPGAARFQYSITNPTDYGYTDINIECSFDYIGNDGHSYHVNNYILPGLTKVDAHSTFSSGINDSIELDHDGVSGAMCSIMHGFFSSPSTYTP
jgi:hypothetical protein